MQIRKRHLQTADQIRAVLKSVSQLTSLGNCSHTPQYGGEEHCVTPARAAAKEIDPAPVLTLTVTFHFEQNVGLRGGVGVVDGKFPESYINAKDL